MSRRYHIHEGVWAILAIAGVAACGEEPAPVLPATHQEHATSVYLRAFSSFDNAQAGEHAAPLSAGPESDAAAPPILRFDDPLGTVYSLTAAELWVESIVLRFNSDQTCAEIARENPTSFAGLPCDNNALTIPGPFPVDLLDGRILDAHPARQAPGAESRGLPALDYRQIELHLAPAPPARRVAGTFNARASFQDHASIRRLTVTFDLKTTIKREVGAPLSPGDSLILSLDIAGWLDGIPVTHCLEHGYLSAVDGEVILDSNLDTPMHAYYMDEPPRDCQDAQDQFRENFERSLRVRIEPENSPEKSSLAGR